MGIHVLTPFRIFILAKEQDKRESPRTLPGAESSACDSPPVAASLVTEDEFL